MKGKKKYLPFYNSKVYISSKNGERCRKRHLVKNI